MQKEITGPMPLLDEKGDLTCPGYAKKLYPVYSKPDTLSKKFHTKEWDYYYIGNQHFGLALTIDDNGYMGLDSISFLDFDEGWEITRSYMQWLTFGKKGLPVTSVTGDVSVMSRKYHMAFINNTESRHLEGSMSDFRDSDAISFKIDLTQIPEESMVIMTPFEKKAHYYFNQKINCMKAEGEVTIGARTYTFREGSFGTLDWGRGIWTYRNTWYWSSLSTQVNGEPFGFNLGYGFGDTSAASENMLFYKGRAHKLEQVTFHIPEKDGKDDFMSPWTFTSSDGRVELTFTPVLDRKSKTDVLIICSDQHQVFGRFNGKCILDDGTVIELKDKLGFAEKVFNKW